MEPERLVALVDMDCFYCQVFVRQDPELRGTPLVVLTYSDQVEGGSSAIAVSYEARKLGVKRGMRKRELAVLSPEIRTVVMPNRRNKMDLSMFRAASSEVMAILARHATIFERASIDEAFIDITANVKRMVGLPINKSKLHKTYVAGYEGSQEDQMARWSDHVTGSAHHSYDYKLTLAAVYVNMIRAEILSETQLTCSAGVGTNKIVAKLAAGLHKPDSLTIIPPHNIPALYSTINFTKIRNFGGKLGSTMQAELGIQYASELVNFTLPDLISRYGDKTGGWIYNIARGEDREPVKERSLVKQTACSKNFPGGLTHVTQLEQWVGELAEELEERLSFELSDHHRIPTQLVTHLRLKEGGSCSTQMPLLRCDVEHIIASTHKCVSKRLPEEDGGYSDVVLMLSICAAKFVPAPSDSNDIYKMLKSKATTSSSSASSLLSPNRKDKSKENKKQSLSGFFEKLKCDAASSSKGLENEIVDEDSQSPVKESSECQKENNMNVWNSLSEEDTKVMLRPIEGTKTKCPVCNKPIVETKLAEHLDFHTALTLQRQIESELRLQNNSAVSPKRKLPQNKRSGTGKRQKVVTVQTKNIASYFKKV